MAIKIIFGPGGSGKSFFQMHVIIKQLRETQKNICTNLAISVPAFNSYLERHFPEERLNLIGRLRILTDEETFEFWKYRGPHKWTGHEYDMEADKGVHGVCYVIDEAGVSGFSATGWAQKMGQGTRGERCLWYLDQQRKFGDDVFASTNGRSPEQIAKPFRDKAHGFIKLKNGYLQQYGMFKGRSRFEWREFVEEPRKGSEDIAKGVFTLGELADCYRTQDGVGVVGSAADKGRRAKGIPILWVVPAALVLALCCVFVPWLLGKGASHFITGGKSAPDVHAPATVAGVSSSIAGGLVPAPSNSTASSASADSEIWPVGYVVRNQRVNVFMSDGTIRTEKDSDLSNVNRNSIMLAGKKLYLRPRSFTPPPSTAVTTAPDVTPSGAFQLDKDRPSSPTPIDSIHAWDPESRSWVLKNPPVLGILQSQISR